MAILRKYVEPETVTHRHTPPETPRLSSEKVLGQAQSSRRWLLARATSFSGRYVMSVEIE